MDPTEPVPPSEVTVVIVTGDPTQTAEPRPDPAFARQKTAAQILFALIFLVPVALDYLMFLFGARLTLSQLWLGVNRAFWPATWVLALLCGALIQHVSIPGPPAPGYVPERAFWIQAVSWTCFFWLGRWVAWKWLWQLPDVD